MEQNDLLKMCKVFAERIVTLENKVETLTEMMSNISNVRPVLTKAPALTVDDILNSMNTKSVPQQQAVNTSGGLDPRADVDNGNFEEIKKDMVKIATTSAKDAETLHKQQLTMGFGQKFANVDQLNG